MNTNIRLVHEIPSFFVNRTFRKQNIFCTLIFRKQNIVENRHISSPKGRGNQDGCLGWGGGQPPEEEVEDRTAPRFKTFFG